VSLPLDGRVTARSSVSSLLHSLKTFVCRQVTFTFPLFCISSLFLYSSLKCFSALKKVFIPAISVTAHCASLISYNLFLYTSLIVLFFFSFLYILLILLCQSCIFILSKTDPSLESLFPFLFSFYFNSVDNIERYISDGQFYFFIQPHSSLHISYCIRTGCYVLNIVSKWFTCASTNVNKLQLMLQKCFTIHNQMPFNFRVQNSKLNECVAICTNRGFLLY